MAQVEINAHVSEFLEALAGQGGKSSADLINEVLYAYCAGRGFSLAAVPRLPSSAALPDGEAEKVDVVVAFRLISRVPLLDDAKCEPFARATEVTLLAGKDAGLPIGRLVGLRVAVTIPLSELPNRVGHLPHLCMREAPSRIRMPEVEQAHSILQHVLAVLRLKGVEARYNDVVDGTGSPMQIVIRKQIGGRWHSTQAFDPSPSLGYPDIGIWEHMRCLDVPHDLLATLWRERRAQVALLAGGPALDIFSTYQRTMLVVESRFPKKKHRRKERATDSDPVPPDEVVRLLRKHLDARDPQGKERRDAHKVAVKLYKLRDQISHLQRQAADGSKVPPYGLDPHDGNLVVDVLEALPLALHAAWSSITEVFPSAQGPFELTTPPLARFAAWLESGAFNSLSDTALHTLESTILSMALEADETALFERWLEKRVSQLPRTHMVMRAAVLAGSLSRLALVRAVSDAAEKRIYCAFWRENEDSIPAHDTEFLRASDVDTQETNA